MRNSIAGTWVYATVLIFMVALIAYVTIQINYANAYEISENIIKAVEEYEGLNKKSLDKIDKLLSNTHTVTGGCKDGEYGIVHGTTGTIKVDTKPSGKYSVCVSRNSLAVNGVNKCYYQTTIFFSFNLPVLGDLYSFKIPGETMGLRYTTDDYFGACK
ncbi:MAG: hypothetical protein K5666_00725 [Bacilli bacterium]|nr:hypothetical protein [Bacilli bacterium]